jgi:hypothetical protein
MFSTTGFVTPGMNGLRTSSRMGDPHNAWDEQTTQSVAGDGRRRLAERVHRCRRDVLEPML